MSDERRSAGDPIPSDCVLIEVHVVELKQLFNAMDPSPFREQDLDPNAEEFIVGWGNESPKDAQFALLVHLDRPAGLPGEPAALRDVIREFFSNRSLVSRRRLGQLLRRGRTSLLIGLIVLAIFIGAGDLMASALGEWRLGSLVRESLLIGGWVAMWRPLEIFLYDWWPIRADVRLYDRLSAMPVKIMYGGGAEPDAWRRDWPASPMIRQLRADGASRGEHM